MEDEMWVVWLSLGNFAFMGSIIWAIVYYQVKKSKERSEERLGVLEQLGSSQELTRYLSGEEGDKLLRIFGRATPDPRSKIFIGLATGLVLLFSGLAFLVLARLRVFGDADTFLIPGVLGCFAGTAVLISVAIGARLWKTDGVPKP